mmetsp:Transcript_25821/g.63876  ORF Transcript_25821/g.63876 Transcript_25821/m.63876 type:complete len:175 (+) Transcript_25821:1-525(+)
MLPALGGSHKIDWQEANAQSALLAVFCLVGMTGFLLLQYTIRKVNLAKDERRVANPGEGPYMPAKAADGTVSVQEYDVAKLKELKMQFMLSVGIVAFLHIKWGYTQPILVMSLMQPMQFWGMQAFHIHLRGVEAVGQYARPWAKADSGNPLAQWADRKKREAEEAAAAAASKND